MKYGSLIIEKKESQLLESLLRSIHNAKDASYKGSMAKLAEELKTANIISEEEFPEDVIRFNSKVEIETFDGVRRTYQLVRPEESNVAQNKISILAPLGSALIGYSSGDEITWQFPNGEKKVKILKVETPDKISENDIKNTKTL